MQNSRIKTYWRDSETPYDLLYGIPNPTSEQFISIIEEKLVYCDGTYIPIINQHFKDIDKRTVLEFGSGQGIMAKYLSPKFKKYICVDVIEDFLNLCREYTKESDNVEYELLQDYYFTDFSIKNNSVDIIKSTHVFCHCNYYEFIVYFEKFYKLLKKGGIILFDIYNSDCLSWDDKIISGHKDLYKHSHILEHIFNPISSKMVKRELMKMGFEEIFDSVHEKPGGWNLLGFKKI